MSFRVTYQEICGRMGSWNQTAATTTITQLQGLGEELDLGLPLAGGEEDDVDLILLNGVLREVSRRRRRLLMSPDSQLCLLPV